LPFAERVFEALVDLVLLEGEEGVTVGVPVSVLRAHRVNGRACGPAGAVGAFTVNVGTGVRVRLTDEESLKDDNYRKLLAPLQLITLPDGSRMPETESEREASPGASADRLVSSCCSQFSVLKPITRNSGFCMYATARHRTLSSCASSLSCDRDPQSLLPRVD
jgi:hypothetical protein